MAASAGEPAGVPEPVAVGPPDAQALAAAVAAGERRALARAITLIESTRPDHRRAAEALLTALAPHAGGAVRVGLSGVPGAGKSTLIEALGKRIIAAGQRVAVLAVDPSSSLSGGSVLGDKTRMPGLARDPHAFIRPSPAAGTLGGVARRTREAIVACEAAGYDVIIVETVGVGQSESAVAGMTDMFVLVLAPGAGDELQGIKRGVVELADMVLVNKADGDLADAAGRAAAEYANALRLLRPRLPDWEVPVLACSARDGTAIDEVWNNMCRHDRRLRDTGDLARRRAAQAREWMWNEAADALVDALRQHPAVHERLPALERSVTDGSLPPTLAAERLVQAFLAAGGHGEDGGGG